MKYFEELYSFSKILVAFSLLLFIAGFYFASSDQYKEAPEEPVAMCGNVVEKYKRQERDSTDKQLIEGKLLFESNCIACHGIYKVQVGPALKDVAKRRDLKWIRSFVRNSQQMIHVKKDPYAVALYNQYNKTEMTAFTGFSDKEIDAIVHYINSESDYVPKYISDIVP